MLFTLKSYRAFATLVGLFVLVVQVVAVSPKVKNSQVKRVSTRQIVGAGNLQHSAFRTAHFDAIDARIQATKAHVKVSNANRVLARKHEHYALGLPQPQKGIHRKIAKDHNDTARYHRHQAAIHKAHADTQRAVKAGAVSTLRRSKAKAEEATRDANVLHKHAKMLDSAMNSAIEHRIASAIHREAGRLAVDGRHSAAAADRHRQRTQEHDRDAFRGALFAVENSKPLKSIGHSADEGITRFDKSASDAKLSVKDAHASIQRSMAAATNA